MLRQKAQKKPSQKGSKEDRKGHQKGCKERSLQRRYIILLWLKCPLHQILLNLKFLAHLKFIV
eukprot:UN08404